MTEPALPSPLFNVFDYERAAQDRLEAAPLAYFAGGAMDERTLEDNRAAFSRRRLVPRVMRDVSVVDTSVEVFGGRWPAPLWICPMATQRLAHPDGELATARAAAARGMTMTLSTSASTDLAEVAGVGGRLWFQLYWLADSGARQALVERTVASGYEALVLTVDLPRLGRREHALRTPLILPDGVGLPNLGLGPGLTVGQSVQLAYTANLTWTDLEWLVGFGLPVIVKGILHPEDARLAIEHGAAGVGVSNHGGRQLDGAIASLDALEPIVDEVAGRVPVFFDSGVRRGTDALVALCLGATAVGIGRPVIWGLTVDGERGVGAVLDLVAAELELSMALVGAPSTGELVRDMVVRSGV